MPESVIVDDGGSTRIRWNNTGLGAMPSLVNVGDLGPPRKGSKQTITPTGPFTQVRIVYQDEDGIAHEVVQPFNKSVQIFSDLEVNVQVEKNGNDLTITIYSDVTLPQVAEKQHNGKRHYVVSNSGNIEKVSVDNPPVAVFDVAGRGQTTPAKINKPVLHTSVFLS